ncbi:hypothetical protein [Endozoicomonas sp. SESOKO1]|uniref:hypothetical protein n=1 Tax=Endozoicomonas sp. SESOKO1 TaxID=2828742 RepID=UPI002147D23E|nr:hypothetical protein [Endozoicomonas sp. SESOKO1]
MDINEILANLHTATLKELLERIESGNATATELNVARQMLKDNNVIAIATPDSPLAELEDVLEDFDPEAFGNVVPLKG